MTPTKDELREYEEWRDEVRKPKTRLRVWGLLAVACAFVGDGFRAEHYSKLAESERALIGKAK